MTHWKCGGFLTIKLLHTTTNSAEIHRTEPDQIFQWKFAKFSITKLIIMTEEVQKHDFAAIYIIQDFKIFGWVRSILEMDAVWKIECSNIAADWGFLLIDHVSNIISEKFIQIGQHIA